ncbi:MAG: hypothetical protein ACLRRT_04850 [Ruthenibacterium lactatiformans]
MPAEKYCARGYITTVSAGAKRYGLIADAPRSGRLDEGCATVFCYLTAPIRVKLYRRCPHNRMR